MNEEVQLRQWNTASTVNILQKVQNAAARLICNLKPCEPVTASLKQLHWLPVKQWVQYKLCMIMYSIHFGLALLYITELVSTVAAQTSRPGLCSADMTNYVQPRTRTMFGECAVLYAGPAVWNLLPDDLRRTLTIKSFKCKLKTYLFISAFSWFYFLFSYNIFWHLYCTDVLIFVTGTL